MEQETELKTAAWEGLKDEIKDYIEKNQPEFYWDYRDEIDKDSLAKIFDGEDGLNDLENELWENNIDYICDLENEAIKDVILHFDLTENNEDEDYDIDEDEDFKDFCKEYISVDFSIKDLLRNTGEKVFFYDTGLYVSDTCWTKPMEIYNILRSIKNTLKIKTPKYDKALRMMICQASYGGELVVYFMSGIEEAVDMKKWPSVEFGNMRVAIVDHSNGSGDDCELPGHSATFEITPDCITFDESIKYNYSFAVCGMVHNWCDETTVKYSDWKPKQKIVRVESEITRIKKANKRYDLTYKAGGCTFGDMDIKRHRGTFYKNEYPCGTHCPNCGTFWID